MTPGRSGDRAPGPAVGSAPASAWGPSIDTVAVGDEIGPLVIGIERARLVRYAGASGDFNPIHWSDRVATSVGLDGVIAHGMLTMALAGRLVTDWVGDPGAVASFEVRFTRPVQVPDPGEVELTIAGRVAEIDHGADGAARARIDLTVTVAGRKVLGKARAVVRI